METASVGRRVAGRLITGALPIVIALVFVLARPGEDPLLLVAALLGPGSLVLETVLLRAYGGHVGHLLLGMRVATPDGRLTWPQAVTRVAVYVCLPLYVLQLVPSFTPLTRVLNLVWVIALLVVLAQDPDRRSVHDRLAGTTVVRV